MQNLARNAIEAMAQKGGRLTLSGHLETTPDGRVLLLGVADTGPGIPAEIEGRLFQSFVTSGKKNGTGLGLAIVKKIVEEHDGTIETQSSPAGTSFTLRLPMSDERKAAPRPRDHDSDSVPDAPSKDGVRKRSKGRVSRPRSAVPKRPPTK